MKKVAVVLLCLIACLFAFVACKNEDKKSSAPSLLPSDTCEHEWALSAFVTEETDISFAGRFSCTKCKKEEVHSFSYTDIDIPLVNIKGDVHKLETKSKQYDDELKVTVDMSFQSADFCLECPASLKLQGKSTRSDPKQNFSVNLLDPQTGKKKDAVFVDSWGAGSKYVLKANYTEPSAVRNIALSALYGQVAHSRNLADHYTYLVNGGAVDGYPVLLYVNEKYYGLYNWVIRKDKWLYGMGDASAGEAVLCGSDMEALESDEGVVMLPDGIASSKSWDEEYVNEAYGAKGWAESSFNEMLFAIRNADQQNVRAAIAEYTELERTLDVLLFNSVFGTTDNVCGNQVWCTYDGKKWAPVVYDLDRALGRSGNCLMDPNEDIEELIAENVLYDKILNAYMEEAKARYASLRRSVFTVENVMSVLRKKLKGVDDRFFVAELEKWPEAPWRECEGSDKITGFEAELDYVEEYLSARFFCCDQFFGIESV